MIKMFSYHNILLLLLICIILLLISKPVFAGDVWRHDIETEKILLSQKSTVKVATDAELLNISSTQIYTKFGYFALNELVERDEKKAIPILESLATTVYLEYAFELAPMIAKLELASDLKNKTELQQLQILMSYIIKNFPDINEFKYDPNRRKISSLKMFRYSGATNLIALLESRASTLQEYEGLRNHYISYSTDSIEQIRNFAKSKISKIDYRIAVVKEPIRRREQYLTYLQQAKNGTLFAIISTARTQVQAGDYTLGESAIIATNILAERKVLSEVEKTKQIEIFSPKKQNN
jgi:hypothetical protein